VRRDKPQQVSSRAQDALTEEQLDALLDAVNARYPSGKRNLALLLVMADAGLRVSEAVSLKTTDLVVEGGQYTHVNIRRGKGGKPGPVALTVRAAAKLGAWLTARATMGFGKGYVFCTISKGTAGGHWADEGQALEPGRPLSTEYVRQLVRRMADRAGIESRVTPHTLRHTFVTRLLRTTGNLELTRKALRHSHIQTTVATYAHLVQEDVDRGIRRLPGNGTPAARSDLAQQLATLRTQLDALAAAAQQGSTPPE
jgi:site-specific recombinase XerD